MRVLNAVIAAVALAALPAAASANEAPATKAETKLAKLLEGRVAGEPVDCIQLRSIRSSQIIDGTAIVYEVGSTRYVNRPEGGANSLRFDPILVTDTRSPQLCSIDTVKLIDRSSHFYAGFVSLGKFVPYTKPRS